MRAFAEMVAPIRCVACRAEAGDELCASCAHDVRVLRPPWCERCGTSQKNTHSCPLCSDLAGFRRARSLVVFAEPARRLTLQLKRRGRRELASAIGELLALLVRSEDLLTSATRVTWVPGGRTTRRVGFDHAAQVASGLAQPLGIVAQPLLKRVQDGPRQADVPLERRRPNVAGRFAAQQTTGHVLVVDDVYTTGSTAEACAIALRAAGAEVVDVVTWARTVRRRPSWRP